MAMRCGWWKPLCLDSSQLTPCPIHLSTSQYTGVWVIKAMERQRKLHNEQKEFQGVNIFEQMSSLSISTILANEQAFMDNKRFVDVDLNREFSHDKLCVGKEGPLSLESKRARELSRIIGPKFNEDGSCNEEPATDVCVDLHTTTANMGISLIVPEGDALMAAAATYVMHKCQERYGPDKVQCVIHAMPNNANRMNLSSCGRHGFTIEVGPTPQGVIRHDIVEKTEVALHALLEFLHTRNCEANARSDAASTVLDRLRLLYPDGAVPCFRSAPARRPGELSGKITWPTDPENPNFPAVMVHQSLQDKDFELIRVGDPLFVALDGTVIPYDGSHGDEVYLIFINEGGYYYASSGTGIGVSLAAKFDWQTGLFVEDDNAVAGERHSVLVQEDDTFE